jgi:hypothetical protein|tara:strand:+ start:1692 stop:1838 length:147 start_codon:yes stop_codon:yes gene_type:complete
MAGENNKTKTKRIQLENKTTTRKKNNPKKKQHQQEQEQNTCHELVFDR